MSNFTPLVEKTYEFDGDTVLVKFSRLRRKDMIKILPAFAKVREAQEEQAEDEPMSEAFAEGVNDVLNDVAELIPGYVKSFNGLKDSAGGAIDIDTVVSEMYFSRLSGMIVMDMIKESGVPGEA